MNNIILMQHLSLQLHTAIKYYSKDNKLIEKVCMRPTFEDPLEQIGEVSENILSSYNNNTTTIFALNEIYYYSIICTDECKFLVGPVRLEIPMETKLNEYFELPNDYDSNSCVKVENNEFFYYILFLSNLFSQTTLTVEKLLFNTIDDKDFYNRVNQNLSNHLFDVQESGTTHNSYEQELREQTSIENGDILSLELAFKEDQVGTLGTLAKDKIRSIQNIAIVVVTLASRSAIRGGLPPEEAYSMADIYTRNICELSDPTTIGQYLREAEREYTRRVHYIRKLKEKTSNKKENVNNFKVTQCKNFIFSNLHSQITLNDIAKELNMHPNYLSELFKEHEGVPISQYIILEKINRAKNLLKYSDYTYIEIATYLGFCSQSHLGSHFKKHTGYTLKCYRDTFGNSNFIN